MLVSACHKNTTPGPNAKTKVKNNYFMPALQENA
jgi:hypothetical protein